MLTFLFVLFLAMLISSYFLFKKDIIEPSIIVIVSYLVSIFCALTNINKWGIEFSINAFFIVLLGTIEFVLASYIIYTIFKRKYREAANIEYNDEKDFHVSKIFTTILIIYDLIALGIFIYNVLAVVKSFGNYTSFSNALQIYKQHTSYAKDAELPDYVTIMIKPIIASAYIYTYIFIRNVILNKKEKICSKVLKNSYYLIPTLIYIIQRLSESNRGSIINFFLSTFVMAIILYNIKNNWNKSIKLISIAKLGGVAIVGLIVFYFSAQLVGRVNSKGIVDYITCYCGGSIECFDLYIKNDYKQPDYSGTQTFGRTIHDLNKLRIIHTEVKNTDTQPFKFYKDNLIGNVYTSYQRWIQDFGIMGIIILQLILAIVFNIFYNVIKYIKISNRLKEYLIIIYSYLIYTLFMHPIDSLFYLETFTIATAGVFLMITILYYLITMERKTDNNEKNIDKVNNKKKTKLKILYITPALNVCGGIESYCMNYYRNISSSIEFDFATHDIKDDEYKNEINKNGGKVFVFSPLGIKTIFKSIRQIKDFLKNNNDYDIIHCNMANAAIFYFYYAKKYGISIRIMHSHQNNYADKLSHKIRNIPLILLGKRYATHRFACSKIAGDFLFKDKSYYIIKNAIDLERYKFNENIRNIIRKRYNLKDELILGTVGRLTEQKNQIKLIEIMKQFVFTMKKDVKLLIIGEGHLENFLKNKTKEYNLENRVIFIGSVDNVQDYLQAMDCFVLPSLYEGLGIVNIEAQAAGLPTIVSNKVPEEAKVTDLCHFIDLNETAEIWANEIYNIGKNKNRGKISYIDEIKNKGYEINEESKKLEKIYFEIVNKEV